MQYYRGSNLTFIHTKCIDINPYNDVGITSLGLQAGLQTCTSASLHATDNYPRITSRAVLAFRRVLVHLYMFLITTLGLQAVLYWPSDVY